MLVSFTIENFKSFREMAQLSLLAKRTDKTARSALMEMDLPGMGKQALLPAAAIYGANASGKTNFLLAIKFMRMAVLQSQTNWKPYNSIPVDCHLSESDQNDTQMEIQFIHEDVRYRYGFSANKKFFSSEWLYSYPKGRERELFFRTTADNKTEYNISIRCGSSFKGLKRDHESSARRVRHNSLFLSAASQDNQEDSSSVYKWFKNNIIGNSTMSSDDSSHGFTSLLAHEYEQFKILLEPLIRMANPAVKNIVINKREDEKSRSDVDQDEDIYEQSKKYEVSFVLSDGGNEITVDRKSESRGVKRLYSIAFDIISCLKFGRVLIVDELESSMHSQVASQILALFQSKASNPHGAQLVFTTHETRLLNLQHLRRDQIWFCEKKGISSALYPLSEFAPRSDENFESSYLKGKYGAVPQAVIDRKWIEAINDEAVFDNEEDING